MRNKNLKLAILPLLFWVLPAWAQFEVAPDRYVDLLPLQLQNRYEDSSAQERTNRQYQAYTLGLQFSIFRMEVEYNQFYDKTGGASLKVEQTIKEYNLGLGYRVYQLISDDRRLTFNIFGKLWLGQTQTTVDTTFAGTLTEDVSDKENVLGAGASALVRISYFIAEADFRFLNSKNMNPQTVPVFGVKVGATIPY
jgi:hypothetical protein